MRFRNLSDLTIPKALWLELAATVGVGRKLQRAAEDDLGLYATQTLRVTVYPTKERRDNTVIGSYTYGHISLYPCPRCNPAFLTEIYLHELVHAWVDEFRPREVYDHWSACPVADEFARRVFVRLGGRINRRTSGRICRQYSFHLGKALSRTTGIAHLVDWMGRAVPTKAGQRIV